MPNPTFQAIVSAVNQSGAAFRSVRTDLAAVRREADATRGALVEAGPAGHAEQPVRQHASSRRTLRRAEHSRRRDRRSAAVAVPVLTGLGAAGSVTGLFALVDKVASCTRRVHRHGRQDRGDDGRLRPG